MSNLLNYTVYLSQSLDAIEQSSDDERKILIDDEIDKLEHEYQKAKYDSVQGLKLLKRNVLNYNEPESVRILENKIDKEKMYL